MSSNTVPLKTFMEGHTEGGPLSTVPCLTPSLAISPTASVKTIKKRGYQVLPINQTDLKQLLVLALRFIRDGDFGGENMTPVFNEKLKAAMLRYRTKRIVDQAKYDRGNRVGDRDQLRRWLEEFDKLPPETDPLEVVQYAIHIEASFEFGVRHALNPYRSIMRKIDTAVMRILEGLVAVVSETLVECLDDEAAALMSSFSSCDPDERLELRVLEAFEPRLKNPLQPQRVGDSHEWDPALEALYENVRLEEDRAGLQTGSGLTHALRFANVIQDYLGRYPADEEGSSTSLLNIQTEELYSQCMEQIIRPVSGRPAMKLAETERQIIRSFSSFNAMKVALFTVILAPLSVEADLKFASDTTMGLTSVGVAQNHAIMALVQLQLLVIHSLLGEDESYRLFAAIQRQTL